MRKQAALRNQVARPTTTDSPAGSVKMDLRRETEQHQVLEGSLALEASHPHTPSCVRISCTTGLQVLGMRIRFAAPGMASGEENHGKSNRIPVWVSHACTCRTSLNPFKCMYLHHAWGVSCTARRKYSAARSSKLDTPFGGSCSLRIRSQAAAALRLLATAM